MEPAARSMNKVFHVNRQGQKFGPYSLDQVRNLLAAGRLQWNDLAWIEGTEEWKPLAMLLSRSEIRGKDSKDASSGKAWRTCSWGIGLLASVFLLGVAVVNLQKMLPLMEVTM